MSSPPPNPLWTRVDVTILSPQSLSAVSEEEYSPSVILPADETVHEHSDTSFTTTTTEYCTIYGPGELELYRHHQLLQNVKDAKLKVWYPGSWMHHSSRAYFRTKLVQGILDETTTTATTEKDENDDTSELVLLKFRSNSKIVSAHYITINAEDDEFECDDCTKTNSDEEATSSASHRGSILQRKGQVLRWKSSTIQSSCSEEVVYDHIVLAPVVKDDQLHDFMRYGNEHDGVSSCPAIILELDSSHQATDCVLHDLNEPDQCIDDDGANLNMITALDFPPPCITLEMPHPTTNQCNERHHPHWQQNWEWKRPVHEDWIPIHSGWLLQQCERDRKQIQYERCSNDTDGSSAGWQFPHQKDLCQISTVLPVHQLMDAGTANKNERIYDFGKELLGKVHISIPNDLSTSHQRTVLLRVGETMEEVMNDDEEYFEQCVDVCDRTLEYELAGRSCLTWSNPIALCVNDGCSNTQHCSLVRSLTSCHLLAFRYVRIIIPNYDHLNINVTCQVHSPFLQQRGSFSCDDESSRAVEPEHPNLETRIWQTATYTLQLCIHNNFIIDGIKRDRLPWMGDLAVSLMANAYTFRDEECIRWTLAVLGRCGIDNISSLCRSKLEEPDSSSLATSHVNGIVDYSLWYFICHWQYQRYFGDKSFLHHEWRLIEHRLRHLLMSCSDEETGRFIINDGDCLFIDWTGDHAKKSISVQILWWYALNCAISLAQTVVDRMGESGQHRRISEFIAKLSERQSRAEKSYLQMDDVQLGFSRHSHILGVVSGLYKRLDDRASEGDWFNPGSSDDKWRTVRRCRNLYDRTRKALMGDGLQAVATPYMKHLEVIAICALGERMHALDSIRSYWGGMLDANATTFFESFNENETLSDVPEFYNRRFGRSLCHAWAAGPCALYPEVLLGLRPLSDGWREWLCDPLQCPAYSVSASIQTKYGVISVTLDIEYLHVIVPEGGCMVLLSRRYTGGKHSFSRESLISSQDIHEWSMKYRGWQHHADHVIKPDVSILGFEGIQMTDVPTVYQLPGDELFYMSFIGFDGVGYQSFIAESTDLISWTNYRLAMGYGEQGMFDFGGVVLGAYLYESYDVDAPRVLKRVDGKFYSLYGAYAKKDTYEPDPGFQGLASSIDGLVWEREKSESILSIYGPGMVKDWEKDSIYQPWLVYHNGTYYNFYNAKEMPQWIEQIGLATSKDMYNWTRHEDNPVLRVSERDDTIANDGFDTQFAADAKVFWDKDHWVMFYFGVGKGGAHIMVAFSKDLLHWVRDPTPLYTAGENPSGLDKHYAHKISLVWDSRNERLCMFYCAVGDAGRGIGLITSHCPSGKQTVGGDGL